MSYFKPWKRKLGVVTLMMACVCMAAWVRSLFIAEQVFGVDIDTMYSMNSRGGNFEGAVADFGGPSFETMQTLWTSSNDLLDQGQVFIVLRQLLVNDLISDRFEWECCGLKFYAGSSGDEPEDIFFVSWTLPYWQIAFPITALSAYLLLSKPRVTPAKVPE